jgi:hypothetical protein
MNYSKVYFPYEDGMAIGWVRKDLSNKLADSKPTRILELCDYAVFEGSIVKQKGTTERLIDILLGVSDENN